MTEEPLFELIPQFEPPLSYTADDQYRDFRRVFLETDEGKRVLHQILAFCRLFQVIPPTQLSVELLAMHNGERHVAKKILEALYREPKQQPAAATRKRSS